MSTTLDARKDFLSLLAEKCPNFHEEFSEHFLTDKFGLNGIESDFLRAVSKIKGILVLGSKKGSHVIVEHPDKLSRGFSHYEDLFEWLLRELTEVAEEEKPSAFYATEIHAVGEDGVTRVYEGKPVCATSLQAAKDFVDRFMPYARVSGKQNELSILANKA